MRRRETNRYEQRSPIRFPMINCVLCGLSVNLLMRAKWVEWVSCFWVESWASCSSFDSDFYDVVRMILDLQVKIEETFMNQNVIMDMHQKLTAEAHSAKILKRMYIDFVWTQFHWFYPKYILLNKVQETPGREVQKRLSVFYYSKLWRNVIKVEKAAVVLLQTCNRYDLFFYSFWI